MGQGEIKKVVERMGILNKEVPDSAYYNEKIKALENTITQHEKDAEFLLKEREDIRLDLVKQRKNSTEEMEHKHSSYLEHVKELEEVISQKDLLLEQGKRQTTHILKQNIDLLKVVKVLTSYLPIP